MIKNIYGMPGLGTSGERGLKGNNGVSNKYEDEKVVIEVEKEIDKDNSFSFLFDNNFNKYIIDNNNIPIKKITNFLVNNELLFKKYNKNTLLTKKDLSLKTTTNNSILNINDNN